MKPPILCLHGLWATPGTFARLAPRLEALGHPVATPALPMHDRLFGDLPEPALGAVTVEDYARFLVAEVERMPAPPVIIGHSMGGMLAQVVAARVAHAGLVLLSPAATATTAVPAFATVRTMGGTVLKWQSWKSPVRIDWDAARWGIYNGVPEAIARAEYGGLVWDSGRVVAEMTIPGLSTTAATRVDYGRLNRPALVIVGQDDRITVPGIARATARKLNGEVDYHELPGTGHWLFWGDTEVRVGSMIAEWLQRLDS